MIVKSVKTIQQAEEVAEMAKEFVIESAWGWTFDPAAAMQTIIGYVENEDTSCIYIENTGFALVAYDQDFQKEKVGYVSKFYIRKPARGKGAGRVLIKACNDWFDFHDCVKSFATATANLNNGKQFENLLSKYGYNPCGETLVRGSHV